jgi:amidohydrolase
VLLGLTGAVWVLSALAAPPAYAGTAVGAPESMYGVDGLGTGLPIGLVAAFVVAVAGAVPAALTLVRVLLARRVAGGASLFSGRAATALERAVIASVVARMPVQLSISARDRRLIELFGGFKPRGRRFSGIDVVDGLNAAVAAAGGPGDLAVWAGADGRLTMDRRTYDALLSGDVLDRAARRKLFAHELFHIDSPRASEELVHWKAPLPDLAPLAAAVSVAPTAHEVFVPVADERLGDIGEAVQTASLGSSAHPLLHRLARINLVEDENAGGSGLVLWTDPGSDAMFVLTNKHVVLGRWTWARPDGEGNTVTVVTSLGTFAGKVLPQPRPGEFVRWLGTHGVAPGLRDDGLRRMAKEVDLAIVRIDDPRLRDVRIDRPRFRAAAVGAEVVVAGFPVTSIPSPDGLRETRGELVIASVATVQGFEGAIAIVGGASSMGSGSSGGPVGPIVAAGTALEVFGIVVAGKFGPDGSTVVANAVIDGVVADAFVAASHLDGVGGGFGAVGTLDAVGVEALARIAPQLRALGRPLGAEELPFSGRGPPKVVVDANNRQVRKLLAGADLSRAAEMVLAFASIDGVLLFEDRVAELAELAPYLPADFWDRLDAHEQRHLDEHWAGREHADDAGWFMRAIDEARARRNAAARGLTGGTLRTLQWASLRQGRGTWLAGAAATPFLRTGARRAAQAVPFALVAAGVVAMVAPTALGLAHVVATVTARGPPAWMAQWAHVLTAPVRIWWAGTTMAVRAQATQWWAEQHGDGRGRRRTVLTIVGLAGVLWALSIAHAAWAVVVAASPAAPTAVLAGGVVLALTAAVVSRDLQRARPASWLVEAVADVAPVAVQWRRRMHEHPELADNEYWTQWFIIHALRGMGLDPRRSGVTGVVVDIGTGSRIVALRADIDALPVPELSDLPFASKVEGRCHACGHDVHTAVMLGVAQVLAEAPAGVLRGRVRIIFQPAEEQATGATAMIADGVLDGVEQIYSLHVMPQFRVGEIGTRIGTTNFAGDKLTVELGGAGAGALLGPLHAAIVRGIHEAVRAAGLVGNAKGAPLTFSFGKMQTRAGFSATGAGSDVVFAFESLVSGEAMNAVPGEGVLTAVLRTASAQQRAQVVAALPGLVDAAFEAAFAATVAMGEVEVVPVGDGTDRVTITVRGVGGHGSRPYDTVNPSLLVAPVYGLVLRGLRERFGVVGAGEPIAAGGTVVLQGTLRSGTPEARTRIAEAFAEIVARAFAEARAETAEVGSLRVRATRAEVEPLVWMVINDAAPTRLINSVVRKWLGPAGLVAADASPGGDDFAEYTKPREVGGRMVAIPGVYISLGVRAEGAAMVGLHHGGFPAIIDEAAIGHSIGVFTESVITALERRAPKPTATDDARPSGFLDEARARAPPILRWLLRMTGRAAVVLATVAAFMIATSGTVIAATGTAAGMASALPVVAGAITVVVAAALARQPGPWWVRAVAAAIAVAAFGATVAATFGSSAVGCCARRRPGRAVAAGPARRGAQAREAARGARGAAAGRQVGQGRRAGGRVAARRVARAGNRAHQRVLTRRAAQWRGCVGCGGRPRPRRARRSVGEGQAQGRGEGRARRLG